MKNFQLSIWFTNFHDELAVCQFAYNKQNKNCLITTLGADASRNPIIVVDFASCIMLAAFESF